MAHDFAHAYTNVKHAAECLVASSDLRASLNRASVFFSVVNDDDFAEAPGLRLEFNLIRARLRRTTDTVIGSMTRSLDNANDSNMDCLTKNVLSFAAKMNSPEYASMVPPGLIIELKRHIKDPGPDEWDEDIESD